MVAHQTIGIDKGLGTGLEDINTPDRARIHLVSSRNTSLRILAVPAIS